MTTTARPTIAELRALMARMTGDEKHDAAATSTLDVLHVLYSRVLDVDPAHPDDPHRDRFLLSKGHGPMAYYAVLAAHGFLDPAELSTWTTWGSRLGYHPDGVLVPGVEIGSGSLGHGLPLAVGTALGLRARRIDARVVVLVGDAELDEGSNAEAIAYAGRRSAAELDHQTGRRSAAELDHQTGRRSAAELDPESGRRSGLGSLTCVVVDNDSATHRGRLAETFLAEGWRAITVDGTDHDALERALNLDHPDRPLAVVARVAPKES